MELSLFNSSQSQEVIDLFLRVFSASADEGEGQLIGHLVSDLITTTVPEELIGFVASSSDGVIGCIFFSRLIISSGEVAWILSPVAIDTSEQGKGVGQQLIHYGINHLKSLNVDLVITYGDPQFYSKVGFSSIDESLVKAPFKLSQPEGWLAQRLDGHPIKPMSGASRCVKALSDPQYW